MVILIIASVVVFLPVLWIIFLPVNIRLDTRQGLYKITQPATVSVSFHPSESPVIRIRVLGWPIEIRPKEGTIEADERQRKQRRSSRMKSFNAWRHLFSGIVRSFSCRRFICRVDFDDVVLNAQLLPIAYFSSRGPVVLDINFRKEYHLDVWIQVRVYRVLWSFIRFSLTK
jgi:hypothetical protein